MNLIIVESPTKARTFNKILKEKEYFVFATMGHIRDLPASKLSVDYSHLFKPEYKEIKNKEKIIKELKEQAKNKDQIILATDPDREGESIAYHAAYILGFIKEKWPDFKIVDKEKKLKRIVFHEITSHALAEALKNPEEIRIDLIKAQQARRILDRIVGYELSPLLWKKLGKNWLSAGRVQTVALRFTVEREKEIKNFTKEDYIQIYGFFKKSNDEIKAKLTKKDEIPYEQVFKLNLFAGDYTYTKTTINKNNIDQIQKDLNSDQYFVSGIKETISKRTPPPPLTTSLMQQEGFNRFHYSSKMTMKLAQDLYEAGLITYHRTDSFNLAAQFIFKAKEFIEKQFGKDYGLESPRFYKAKSKLAQEAHEAIRPTKLIEDFNTINHDRKMAGPHKNLYSLIFNRAVASQMKEAQIKTVKIIISSKNSYLFETSIQQVVFDGFLKVLNPEFAGKNQSLSTLKENDEVTLSNLEIQESETKPPPRYNEASLIKTLEERGIGRPSTYAPIISLVQEKGYIEKENGYFIPTMLGEKISDYLSQAFPQVFDINFTAQMEENLDKIAQGEESITQLLSDFYNPFSKILIKKKEDKQVINVEKKTEEKCPNCGNFLVIRVSKYGQFYGCSSYPKCRFIKPFLQTVQNKECPECKGAIVVRYTKSRKRFYGCSSYPKCNFRSWKLPG